MVYGVTRIALPSCDWGSSMRAGGARSALAAASRSAVTGGSAVPSDSFVAGPENRLAVPALERLLVGDDLAGCDLAGNGLADATAPAIPLELFNPLVLLGPTGIGKSHLARGIMRHWQALLGESAVEYLTAIDFARQLRDARDEGTIDSFREHLAELQLLVIEDLQRLPLSTFVQRELRDTLDLLIESGAVLVVTAQQPPAAMSGLEAGLRDRLASGLTVRLQPPGVEARLELLQLTATARGYRLTEDQLRQMARKVDGTAPQVIRAMAEFKLSATAEKSPAEHQISNTAAGAAANAMRPPLKIKQIIAVVARYYSLTQSALCSSARRKSLVHARGTAIYLARTLTDLSYAQIGLALGRRDHSTIMHAARTIEKRLVSDASTQQDVEELKRILTAV